MNRNSENRKWLDEYMSLKQVNPNYPFTVPEGYFDELDQHISSCARLHDLKSTNALPGFEIPGNYFDDLADKVQSRINVENLINTTATGFEVPQDYFNNLEQQISSRIFIEEALNTQADSFVVPPDYFSQLNENILNKTVKQDAVKRRGVVRQMFSSLAFKYASAACFALIVGGVVFLNQSSGPVPHNKTYLHKSLSGISVNDIQSYLQLNSDETDTHTLVNTGTAVSSDKLRNDLQDYLDTTQ